MLGRARTSAVWRASGTGACGFSLPPDMDVRLDRVEAGASPIDIDGLDFVRRDTVDQQCDLQRVGRVLRQCAFAGETLHVPELRPAVGGGDRLHPIDALAGRLVASDFHRPSHRARPARVLGAASNGPSATLELAKASPDKPTERLRGRSNCRQQAKSAQKGSRYVSHSFRKNWSPRWDPNPRPQPQQNRSM